MFVKSPAHDRQLVSLEIWSKQQTLPFWGGFFFFLLVSEYPLLVFLPEWQVMCLCHSFHRSRAVEVSAVLSGSSGCQEPVPTSGYIIAKKGPWFSAAPGTIGSAKRAHVPQHSLSPGRVAISLRTPRAVQPPPAQSFAAWLANGLQPREAPFHKPPPLWIIDILERAALQVSLAKDESCCSCSSFAVSVVLEEW